MAFFHICLDVYFKLFYYFSLIVYHATDTYADWSTYDELPSDISLIPAENETTLGTLLLTSCISGTLLSIIMIFIYAYFIYYQRSLLPSRKRELIEPWQINERVLVLETTVSFCELFFKELLQSSILFEIFKSGIHGTCVSKTTKMFTICNIFGNVKLLLCFYTKLCGLGVGEKVKSIKKALACCVGCIGAIIFLCFTCLYFSKIKYLKFCSQR